MKACFLVVALVGCLLAVAQPNAYVNRYKEAFALYQKGEKQKALDIFEKIFAEDSTETNALYFKTVLYTELRQFSEASKGYTQLCRMFPDNANYWGYGSFTYTLLNQPETAQFYANKAVELDPYSYQHMLHLAHACLFLAKTNQAVYWYARALQWLPDQQAFKKSFLADFDLFDSLKMMPSQMAARFKEALQPLAASIQFDSEASALLDSIMRYNGKEQSNEVKDKILAWKRAFVELEKNAEMPRQQVMATFITDLGLQEYRNRNRVMAMSDYFGKAESIYQDTGDSLGLANLYILLSREMLVYQRMENRFVKNTDPLRFAQKAAETIADNNLEALLPSQLHYMAEAYAILEEDAKSLACQWQQLAVSKRLNDGKGYFRATNSLAVYYAGKKQIDSALYYHQLCMKELDQAWLKPADKIQMQLNGFDFLYSAGRYQEVILKAKPQLPLLKRSYKDKYSELCELLGSSYEEIKNPDSAYAYYQQAVNSFLEYSAALEQKQNATLPLQLGEERAGSLWGLAAIAAQRGDKAAFFQWSEMSKDNNLLHLITMEYQPRHTISLSQAMQQMPADAVGILYTGSNNSDHGTALAFTAAQAEMKALDNAAFYQSILQQKFPLSFSKLLEFQGTKASTQKDSADIARTLPIMHFYYQSNATPSAVRSHIAIKKSAVDASKMAAEEKAALSHLLYKLYLQPFEQVLQGKKTIYICGDFLQHFIPFETLLMPDGRYLVEQYNIVYVPSFTIHESLGKREYNTGGKIIAAGNPDYTTYHPENLQGRAYDFSYLGIKSWADLPGTGKELQTLGQTFDSVQIISQRQLSESRLKSMSQDGELKKASILHFALHGIAGTASAREDNSLAVTEPDGGHEDGLLQFYEAYELDIKPQLVCLSACETAIGMMETDGTVTTMGTAFLAAGAKAVLATNWSIDDEATALFMKELYGEIKTKKTSIAEAATNTKRKFIRGEFGERFKDPFFWAPFKYIGN